MTALFNNNAFFLQTTRERMRPATVFSWLLICGLIILLQWLSIFVNSGKYASPHLELFWNLAGAQSLLLFGLATWSTVQMANRERSSGTLDFHRASPSPALAQAAGILFGAPSLEWVIFLLTLPISLILAMASPLGIGQALEFYLSLISSVVLLHLFMIFISLNRFGLEETSSRLLQNAPLLALFFIVFAVLPIMGKADYHHTRYTERVSSVSSHLIGMPVWEKVETIVRNTNHKKKYSHNRNLQHYSQSIPKSYFFNFPVFPLALQLAIQIPLMLLLTGGIIRIIRMPHVSALSKEQLLFTAMHLIFFLFIADDYLNIIRATRQSKAVLTMQGFIFFVSIVGYISALMATPRRLTYIIGLRKMAQLGLKRMADFDDHNSNCFWFVCYAALSFTFFLFYRMVLPAEASNFGLMILGIGLLQVGTFAFALEAFYLSSMGNKRVLFVAALSIPWVFFPVLAGILASSYSVYGSVFSPFYIQVLSSKFGSAQPYNYGAAGLILVLNLMAFVIAAYFAARQRLLLILKG